MNNDKNFNWQEKTILIVDDNDINFEIAKLILIKTNVECIRAINGYEAISICLKNKNINAILMDCMMPGIDGLETTKFLSKIIPETPIIGFTSLDNKDEFIKVGASGFIRKPYVINELLLQLEKHII